MNLQSPGLGKWKMMEDADQTRQLNYPPGHMKGAQSWEQVLTHCCRGQKSSCCSLHLHQQGVDGLSSLASLVSPPRVGLRQRTALLLCYRHVLMQTWTACSRGWQITSTHHAFCCSPSHTHTHRARKSCMFWRRKGWRSAHLSLYTAVPTQSPGVFLHSKAQQDWSTRKPSRYVCFVRQEWGVRNPSLPSWKVSSKKHSHPSPRLP